MHFIYGRIIEPKGNGRKKRNASFGEYIKNAGVVQW